MHVPLKEQHWNNTLSLLLIQINHFLQLLYIIKSFTQVNDWKALLWSSNEEALLVGVQYQLDKFIRKASQTSKY